MAFFWLTGLPGTGKTTVLSAVGSLGYSTFDSDQDGLTVWRNRTTWEVVTHVESTVHQATWLEDHVWAIEVDRVATLADEAKTRDIFVGGAVGNESAVWSLFDKHVCLVSDWPTLKYRLTSRTNNPYGKGRGQLEVIHGWWKSAEGRYRDYGATIVDATRPLDEVVEDVLTATVGTARLGGPSRTS